MYCSYGWDDQYYEYDDTGQYEGWTQDENGEWKVDPAYKEYYEALEARTDNSASKKTDNDPAKSSAVKSSNKDAAHVKDLNKKNIEGKGSNPLYIPYGEEGSKEGWYQNQRGEWQQDPLIANKLNSNKTEAKTGGRKEGGASTNNDKKPAMPAQITSRPRPLEYEDGWYEEPSDGQWYNTYDWYEDENGEWAYDYRMEEYGYVQTDSGEWVPGPGAQQDQQVPSAPTTKEPATKGGLGGIFGGTSSTTKAVVSNTPSKSSGAPPQNGATTSNVSKVSNGGQSVPKREADVKPASKDGFSRVFSQEDPSVGAATKTSLPPRPVDYDDYWYQAEDANWYNEYDDLGYQFADDEILSIEAAGKDIKAELSSIKKLPSDPKPPAAVPKTASSDSKKTKQPRPADYDDHFYQDEFGAWRNQYDDRGLEFDDEGSFYSEKELADAEKDLFKSGQKANENNRTVTKAADCVKAVESTKPVIEKSEVVKAVEPVKDVVKADKSVKPAAVNVAVVPPSSKPAAPLASIVKTRKLPRPADYEDMWYQDGDGNWFNEYDDDGNEYEDDPLADSASDISAVESRKGGRKVSFDQQSRCSDGRGSEGWVGGRSSPRQRWQWAYSRIVQVGVTMLTIPVSRLTML